MKLEILARGPSRRPPSPGYYHWWVSTAYPQAKPLESTEKIFNLHGDLILEDWLPNDPRVIVFGESKKLPLANHLNTDELVGLFGPVFACSISWMLALGIMTRYTEILLNGVDHLRPSERRERESIAYLCGVADGVGVKVHTLPGAGLHFNYGEYPKK